MPVNDGLPPGTGIISLAVSGTTLFAATDSLQIWQRPLSELITSVQEQVNDPFSVNVFPNPFTFNTTVTVNNAEGRALYYVVYDLFGRETSHADITSDIMVFERNNLPPGIYFLEVFSKGHPLQVEKIIIQ